MASTLTEYLNSQQELVREAAEALPHEFSRCTYSLGPLRQAVYLCLTCPEARGICSACSIACHTDHEQIELFPKRNFRCDCATSAIAHPCKLHPRLEEVNTGNKYGQNFEGLFCRCERPYDPYKERETMIQCLACEDWFHESCCNLRERPPSRGNTPEPTNIPAAQQDNGADAVNDDAVSVASSSGLPPPLISADDYESFICGTCVNKNEVLRRWAGSPGVIMVIRMNPASPWHRFELESDQAKNEDQVCIDDSASSPVKSGVKRPSTPTTEVPPAKRPRISPEPGSSTRNGSCSAPLYRRVALQIFSDLTEWHFQEVFWRGLFSGGKKKTLGTGDIFLTEGFRERWCQCNSCKSDLRQYPYLLQQEETYQPPPDPDSTLSLEELGMRALSRIPRDKAIEGIHAFNELKDDLIKFLRPFAQNGKVVNESDVQAFFATLSEGRKNEK